jgi:predicted RNA-binding Zn ribbon-like protein
MRAHGLAGRASLEIQQQVMRLRESLRGYIAIAPEERAVARDAIASVNAASVRFPLQVRIEDGKCDLRPMKGASDFGQVLAQFHDLATLGQLDRLKMCGSPECRWIFFDRSKPANRRWCSSDRCGNREKTRSYRRRWG